MRPDLGSPGAVLDQHAAQVSTVVHAPASVISGRPGERVLQPWHASRTSICRPQRGQPRRTNRRTASRPPSPSMWITGGLPGQIAVGRQGSGLGVLEAYLWSIDLERHPVSRIRSPSLPPLASQV
jgi:hypothetical protein